MFLGTTLKKTVGIFYELVIIGVDPSPPPPINEIFNDEISPLLTHSLPQVLMKYFADVRHWCLQIFCHMKHRVMQKPKDMGTRFDSLQGRALRSLKVDGDI